MSTLKTIEKQQLERLLGMGAGYVMDFTNRTFQNFMQENAAVDIYSDKYAIQGDSKANRLRAFWDTEPDPLVGRVLQELIVYWRYLNPRPEQAVSDNLNNCERIVERLVGPRPAAQDAEAHFLGRDFKSVSLQSVVGDPVLLLVMESRLAEAARCLEAGAPLAAIFLSGSLLEGLLLGAANARPQDFSQAPNSPKTHVGVKPFHEWRLAELIDVAFEVGCITLDVKRFSHVLRDFRNYIHPHLQMRAKFTPDKHTALICLQVLRAAIACLGGEKRQGGA